MKKEFAVLLVLAGVLAGPAAKAQSTINTLTFSGASWNDGGSLDGYFTIQYDADGTPTSVLSADVTTGNSANGFIGFEYIWNVEGKANSVAEVWFDAKQNWGYPANELELKSAGGPYYDMFLDWQGSTPTSLYVGTLGGLYSSETYYGAPLGNNGPLRYISDTGGSIGVVPEPSTSALAGLGITAFLILQRRKQPFSAGRRFDV